MSPSPQSVLKWSTALLLALGIAVIFWTRLRWLAQLWSLDSLYSASVLVPVVSGVLVFLKRRRIRATNPSPIGLALVALAIAASIALDLTQVRWNSATPLLLVLTFSGIVLALWGWHALRTLAFPIAFLVFLVPVPPSMLARVDFPLQEMCARVTAATSHLVGIHTRSMGAMLLFSDPLVRVDIAPACNGLRSTLAMLITAVLLVYLVEGRWYRKAAILAAAVPLAYAANFIRLLGVACFVNWAGPGLVDYEPVWDHLSGLALFAAAILTLILWARVLKCNRLREIG